MFTQGGSNLTFVSVHARKDSAFFQQTFIKHLLCAKHFSSHEHITLWEACEQILAMKSSVGNKRGTYKMQWNHREITIYICPK